MLREDWASMMEWFSENEETFINPFIEQNYRECSWTYEFQFMLDNLIYTKAVIEDYKLSNEEKIFELLQHLYYGKSKIIMVIGARGSGKTATTLWIAEEAKRKAGHRLIYYVGRPENPEIYPPYFRFVDDIDHIPNKCFAIIDEAAIKYSARNFGAQENKELTSQMVIARHKGITLVLITQNVSLVDINVDRLADINIYKMAANYGTRKKRGEMMTKEMKQRSLIMKRMKPRTKEECLVEYLEGSTAIFRKFNNPLPTFWDDEKISKSFSKYRSSKPVETNKNTTKEAKEEDLLA